MAWLVHYKDGFEALFDFKPERGTDLLGNPSWSFDGSNKIIFFNKPISRLILGYEMEYEDDPVEI